MLSIISIQPLISHLKFINLIPYCTLLSFPSRRLSVQLQVMRYKKKSLQMPGSFSTTFSVNRFPRLVATEIKAGQERVAIFKNGVVKMTGRFQTEFKTPWTLMKASEECIPKIFACVGPSEPFAVRDEITYFGNGKQEGRRSRGQLTTGYDRIHDTAPFNPKQQRCDRRQPALIWDGIYEENKRRKVAVLTSHWHGRPNRIQLDFPENKFYRSNKIQDQFYRRNNVNVDYDLDRQCHSY